MGAFPTRSVSAVLALISCAGVVACGAAAVDHSPKNVCRQAQKAAARLVGQTSVHIAGSDPANIECRLSAQSLKLDVIAQASPRAWEEFDTVVVHQAQAFSGSSLPTSKQHLPQDISGLGYNAAWIPSSQEFVATNGTQSTAGSFVTVTITNRSSHRASGQKLAAAVATATLAVAPKGASPGPPPS